MIGIAPTPSAAVRATFIVTASPTSLMTGPWYSASAGRIAAGPNGTTHPVYRRMLGSCPVSKSSINFTNISCSTTWLHVTVIFTNEAFVSRSIYTYLQDTSNNIHYRNVFHVSLKPLSSIWIFQKIGTAQSRALWAGGWWPRSPSQPTATVAGSEPDGVSGCREGRRWAGHDQPLEARHAAVLAEQAHQVPDYRAPVPIQWVRHMGSLVIIRKLHRLTWQQC